MFKPLREFAGGKSMAVKSDIEIAREAKMKPIVDVGKKVGVPTEALLNYGPWKAKVSFDFINSVQRNMMIRFRRVRKPIAPRAKRIAPTTR